MASICPLAPLEVLYPRGVQELASRLRHTMHNTEAEQHKKKKKTTKTKKKAGSSSSSSSTTFYTEAGVAARLKLLENENVKQASSRARTALHASQLQFREAAASLT